MVETTFDKRESTPFAGGGFSNVYQATFQGRPVAVKALKVTGNLEQAYKVSDPFS
jgi:predicted unusual protein kinase regulating ubiquinone biosynthesis (AarF/ABC1/UbiB family)